MMLDHRTLDAPEASPVVAILMCTYNGAPYLAEQIQSILGQTYTNWFLVVSDDGSQDSTLKILESFRASLGERLRVYTGPKKGFAENFISLARNPDLQADYFAFSDQDDIWHVDKLSHALDILQAAESSNQPTIYCGRCRLVDEDGRYIGLTPLFARKPSFRNALVQSLAGANTMLLNSQARQLLMHLPSEAKVIAHDWLAYLLVTACGGRVIYDAMPKLDYRQHAQNIIGGNTGLLGRSKRLSMLMKGRFKNWSQANLAMLDHLSPKLSAQDAKALHWFQRSHSTKGIKSILALRRSGVYRQTWLGQGSLLVAAFLGKI